MVNWDSELTEIETFFESFEFTDEAIVINHYSTITNVKTFYQTNLAIAKRNNGKFWFLPYLHRLMSLKCFFETNRESYPELVINPLKNHV